MFEINVWTVLIAASITAIATGLGALPFLFIKNMSRWWLSISSAFAGGLMLAASHSLIAEGTGYDVTRTLVGILLGLGAIFVSNKLIGDHGHLEIADLEGAGARKALLILGIMTAHSFAEGIGVGVSFGDTQELGIFITTAIAIHNIPEGLAISLVLIPRGTSVWKSAGWSIFSSLPQPLMAVPAFLFVLFFQPFLPVGLGLAAGAMIWMVFAELIPDAMEDASSQAVGATVVLAFVALMAFQNLILQDI
jgi:zinc transporter ZupT